MNNLNDSKRIIIICAILVLSSLIILFITKKEKGTEEYFFQDESNKTIRDYKINEVIPVFVNTEQVAKKYLAEYVNLMLYYPEKAYDLLDSEEKSKRFSSIEEFEYYINQLKSIKLEKAEVKKYSYSTYNKKNTFYIIDNSGNTYRFIENSIMDYTVILN